MRLHARFPDRDTCLGQAYTPFGIGGCGAPDTMLRLRGLDGVGLLKFHPTWC